jgi:hypothetical protein
MQYAFGESRENSWSLAILVMVWVATGEYLIGAIPSIVLTRWTQFPTVAVHCVEICSIILLHTTIWSAYQGTQQYICGSDNSSFLEMYLVEYLHSPRCLVQSWIISYFEFALAIWLAVVSLNQMALIFGSSPFFCGPCMFFSLVILGLPIP